MPLVWRLETSNLTSLNNYVLHSRSAVWNTSIWIHSELAKWRQHCSWNIRRKRSSRTLWQPPFHAVEGLQFLKEWSDIKCLPRDGWRFADGDGYRSKEPINAPNILLFHYHHTAVSLGKRRIPLLNMFQLRGSPVSWIR
jgi:hypothetical protein